MLRRRTPSGATGRRGVVTLARQLVADERALVGARLAFVKAQALRRARAGGIAFGAFVGALVVASSALTALLVGLVLWLATAVAIGWAILIVIGVALAVAGALAWVGMTQADAAMTADAAP